MRRKAKKDITHKAITDIIKELRDKHGMKISFTDTSQLGKFAPDFLLDFGGTTTDFWSYGKDRGILTNGATLKVEVKDLGKTLNNNQKRELETRPFGSFVVVDCFEDVLRAMMDYSLDMTLTKSHLYESTIKIRECYYNKVLKQKVP